MDRTELVEENTNPNFEGQIGDKEYSPKDSIFNSEVKTDLQNPGIFQNYQSNEGIYSSLKRKSDLR